VTISGTNRLVRDGNRSKQHLYSITSSARTSNEGGTVRPSALAVFMLMMSPLFGRLLYR
jgi:hypothetical protein